VTKVCDCQPDP